jgi:retron-type reverse transcriptase
VSSATVTTTLQPLAAQAACDPARVCTPLASLIDAALLREADRHTSQPSAPGLDGVTAPQYAAPRDETLPALPERLRRGRFQAPPVERVWIEKDDGGHRPLGQAACEDTIVQRAVAMRRDAMYAQDFDDCS